MDHSHGLLRRAIAAAAAAAAGLLVGSMVKAVSPKTRPAPPEPR